MGENKYFMYFKNENMSVGSFEYGDFLRFADLFNAIGFDIEDIEIYDAIDDIKLNWKELIDGKEVPLEDEESSDYFDINKEPIKFIAPSNSGLIGISLPESNDKCYDFIIRIPVNDKTPKPFKKIAKNGIFEFTFAEPSKDCEKILEKLIAAEYTPDIINAVGYYKKDEKGKKYDKYEKENAFEKEKEVNCGDER